MSPGETKDSRSPSVASNKTKHEAVTENIFEKLTVLICVI